MAQRTIHMLLGDLLSDKLALFDKNRFLIGSILPDAYINPEDRKVAHFMKYRAEENDIYFDFHEFHKEFHTEIMNDDLYLGYYAHLIEDAFYRYFLYYEKQFLKKMKRYELNILHNDYCVLNAYIVSKYSLPGHLELPKRFEKEPLSRITEFDLEKICHDYEHDITNLHHGKPVLLTEDILDEYVVRYIEIAADELTSVRNGCSKLNVLDYKWENKRE